jgi:hypothetical protein
MNASVRTSYALRDKFSGLYIAKIEPEATNDFTNNLEHALLLPLGYAQARKAQQEFPELYEIIEVDVITSVEYVWRPAITQE